MTSQKLRVRQPFRSSDGTNVNQARYIELKLGIFATDKISSRVELVTLYIQYQ